MLNIPQVLIAQQLYLFVVDPKLVLLIVIQLLQTQIQILVLLLTQLIQQLMVASLTQVKVHKELALLVLLTMTLPLLVTVLLLELFVGPLYQNVTLQPLQLLFVLNVY